MVLAIYPSEVAGALVAPPSKSMSQRAYAAALLHNGRTTIIGAGQSADEQAALSIIQQLGAVIVEESSNRHIIESKGVSAISNNIHCGESGLAARLFSPIAALSTSEIEISGAGSIMKRPMTGLREALTQLGVLVKMSTDLLPITLQGPLTGKHVSVDGSSGSQLLSGLLFALTYAPQEVIEISVQNLTSRPYIDMTLAMLEQIGKPVTNNDYRKFTIDPQRFDTKGELNIDIEGDWSGAANMLVAGAIAGKVTVSNLSSQSLQADRAILEVLLAAGAILSIEQNEITSATAPLQAFDVDATHCPDLFPILAILGALSNGESNISGVHRLFHKESNRAESISEMLQSFEVPFSIDGNTLCIQGVKKLQATIIDSYNDHRIAMAAAVGALRANGFVHIMGAECVGKSYPSFFSALATLGAIAFELKS